MTHASPRRARRVLALLATVITIAPPIPLTAQRGRNAPPVRIGIIDSRRLLHEMPGRAKAQSEFAVEMTDVRVQVRQASDSMKAAVDAFSRVESELRPQQRESAMMLVRARELALEDMVAQLNLRADRRLQELQAPLLAELTEAVRTVRARERLALVLDLAGGAMVVDADATLDIHALVLEELRRRAAASPPTKGESAPRER
jgi:Skp family chaperone for outer membrane proteins